MNFFQRVKIALSSNPERAINNLLNQALFQYTGIGQPIWHGQQKYDHIKWGYKYNHHVYMIIRKIITSAARITFVPVVEQNGEETVMQEKIIHEMLDQPNPMQNGNEFREAVYGFMEATGDAFIYGFGTDKGRNANKPRELYLMPTQYTEIISGGFMKPVAGYKLQIGQEIFFPTDDVLHIKYWNPDYDGNEQLYGLSPIQAGTRLVTKSNNNTAAEAFQLQHNGAIGIISPDDPQGYGLNEAQMDKMEERVASKYYGIENINKILLSSVKLKWDSIGLSPVDLNIIESNQMSMRDLCNVFDFPSVLANDIDNSKFENYMAALRYLYTENLIPKAENLADKLTKFWLKKWHPDARLKVEYSHIPALEINKKELVEWLDKAWWLKASRKQEIMGEEVDKEMDEYFIPSNITSFSDLPGEADAAVRELAKMGISEYK